MGWDAAEEQLSAARYEHACRVAKRLGHPSPSTLPSWVLELIRDCLREGFTIAHDAPTIPPRQRRPGEYSFDEPGEVTRVGRRSTR